MTTQHAPAVVRVVPILRVFDLNKVKEFYLEYLGFKADWEHRFDDNSPLYMQISFGHLITHLSDCCSTKRPRRSITQPRHRSAACRKRTGVSHRPLNACTLPGFEATPEERSEANWRAAHERR